MSGEPAFPVVSASVHDVDATGLTKRELFAAMAMQGLCANSRAIDFSLAQKGAEASSMAQLATEAADALIAQLSKEQP